MHAGLQTSLGILEPEHLYPGTWGEFMGNQLESTGWWILWYFNGNTLGFCVIWMGFAEFCGVEWCWMGISWDSTGFISLVCFFGIYWDYNLVMCCSLPRDWTREDGNTFFFLKERDVVCNLAIEVWNTAHLVRCYQNVDIFSFNKQKAVRLRGLPETSWICFQSWLGNRLMMGIGEECGLFWGHLQVSDFHR